MSERKIIHIDADSFYASVETREDPSLADKPIAVGGQAQSRGVIATCNYHARGFGVRSAMPSSRALQLCPALIILKPRFELYREVSKQFHNIFRQYTDLIEPLSLDEAYLDVSDCEQCEGSATLIAQEIRARVKKELNLTVSAGVAPNKFLAKVGSDWDKPDGCFTIAPHQIADFVKDLPVSRINGVGAVTAAKLGKMGVITCGDLQQIPLETLVRRFGKYGKRLATVSHGKDDRAVQPHRTRKSISVENTYHTDITGQEAITAAFAPLLDELEKRFTKIKQQYLPSKRYVKVKFDNFQQTTIEEVFATPGEPWRDEEAYRRLLLTAWRREERPVRLLGAGLRLSPKESESETEDQLTLFESEKFEPES
jgi:DNA polymerase-4